jgi:hypothetical protein
MYVDSSDHAPTNPLTRNTQAVLDAFNNFKAIYHLSLSLTYSSSFSAFSTFSTT